MAKLDKTQVTVLADSVLCLGNSAMNQSTKKITKKSEQYFEAAEYLKTKCLKTPQQQETARPFQFDVHVLQNGLDRLVHETA